MYQFKQQEEDSALSNLEHYSSQQLSLLNSRKRPHLQHDECSTERERLNQQEIKEFKRQIEERFKLSIANKIYTFPRRIASIADIISSDQETTYEHESRQERLADISNFKKVKPSHKKPSESTRQAETNRKCSDFDKKGKQKLKTNDSTCKRREQESREKTKYLKNEKVRSGQKKKKTERLKTELECSSSFMETIRMKTEKKN